MDDNKTGRNWFFLMVGIAAIGLFIFVVAPYVENRVPPFKALAAFIDRHDINTDAYSYTDSELSAKAGIGARSTIEYMPTPPNQ